SVMFSAHRARYFYSVYVLVIPSGWWGLHDLVRRLARRRGLADELPARPAARAVVAAAAVFCLASLVMDVGGMRRDRWTDYVDPGQAADGIALLRDTARLAPAGQVLLVNFSPPVGSYYSGHPVVGVPRYDDPADLYRVIDHYRCTAAVLTWSPRLAQDLRARGWSTWLERGNWQSWRSPGR
ncbi:MAG: hypothetical protein HYU66_29080, partial [Armatimonadetes bacterium]|nr:hypothetical protein [Armatimonadota bacterium]